MYSLELSCQGDPNEHPQHMTVENYPLTEPEHEILVLITSRRPVKAQASLHIREVSPEPSMFAHMNYGSRLKMIKIKNQTSSPTGWLHMHI